MRPLALSPLVLLLAAAHLPLSSSAGRHRPGQDAHASKERRAPPPLPFVHALYGPANNTAVCLQAPPISDLNEPFRVAVGFFGLSRNMSLTIGSIRRHVFDVLKRNDIRYDVFWSTMMTTSFSNARTKEKRVKLNIDDYKLVSPCRYAVFNQDTIKENLYSEYRRHTDHDAWKDGFVCLRNVLCSYYSQTKLSELISSHAAAAGIRYDAILALRPDTAVMSDIDLPRHLQWIARNPSAKSLWIPDFHSYLGYNDRAAFGSPEYVHTYLTRGSFYLNASFGFDEKKGTVCKNQGRHRNTGECFVKLYLDHFGVSVKASAMRMLRTRYNGVIPKHDHGLINMNIAGNEPAIVDYKRCVRINSSIRDKSQNTFLNSETC